MPHILVNNAGVGGGSAKVADMTTEEFDRVVKTDHYGPFICSREFIKRRIAVGEAAKLSRSEDSDYVTGQSFTIDGGLEMNWGQGA